ncbi:hypothetical protein DV736_g2818, partial [Chaetothyriales sp. CBS 134916]
MEKESLICEELDVGPARKSRSLLKRSGLLLLTAALLWCLKPIFVGRANFSAAPQNSTIGAADVCLSPACIHAASELLYNLSPRYKELDPCIDFEELVCGGWKERHDLRSDQSDSFTGTIMADTSQTLLRHILEAPYPKDSAHSDFSPASFRCGVEKSADEANFDKLKNAYEACLNQDSIQALGIKPLLSVLEELEKLYPPTGDKLESLPDVLRYFNQIGRAALVSLYAGADDKDPDTVVLSIGAPYRVGLPAKERYLDDVIVAKYTDVISKVVSAITKAPIDSHGIVDFEKKLDAASPDAEDLGDITKVYNPMSLEDASALAPELGLKDIIAKLSPVDIGRVIVTSPDYFKNISTILQDTPRETLRGFFVWKATQAYAFYVDASEVKPLKQFNNELQGKDPEADVERWRTCVSHVDGGLPWILSRFFVEKAFSAEAKAFGDQIVSDIKSEFIETLKTTEWMEPEVRKLGVNKVHNIVQKIGYPTKSPNILNPIKLQEYYSTVTIANDTFFSNAVALTDLEVGRMWASLGKPVDRDAWEMSVPTVNAYYNPPGNEIVFPAGIMQFPVFDVSVPAYLSYGAFGSVSGHELSHAFDSTGRHYDETGNYTDWWTDKTVRAFNKRADCFVEQYNKFTLDTNTKPIHVNGKLTLGENIADAGGVAAAFAAWKKRAAQRPNQHLPGLDFFTQEQLFFVNYANWWCGKTRTQAAIDRIYTDPHAPKWARILGTMANSRPFREHFHCPVKEPTCELW